jgi:hypothetical protein
MLVREVIEFEIVESVTRRVWHCARRVSVSDVVVSVRERWM